MYNGHMTTTKGTMMVCAYCGEPLTWNETHNEWHSTSDAPAEHYLNRCSRSNSHCPKLELEPGTRIHLRSEWDASKVLPDDGIVWDSTTRHPYASLVRELKHNTTWHVGNDRIVVAEE